MDEIVRVENIWKKFGKETVLKDVSLRMEAGEICGIVGRNGSGKTVLMKCILGFLKPESGSVTVFGKRIGLDCDFASKTGMMIETPGFIDTESGSNNLRYLLRVRKKQPHIPIEALMEMVGLDAGSRKSVGKYSLGMRQRLGIAQAIMEEPELLVLDEPMNGLDNRGVEEIRSLLLSLRRRGTGILLASHNPLDIAALCDEVYEMDAGSLRKRDFAV